MTRYNLENVRASVVVTAQGESLEYFKPTDFHVNFFRTLSARYDAFKHQGL